jgi:hypothetical protein
MILRAVILSGFLLLSNAGFAQRLSGSAPALRPPPPTLGLTLTVVPPGSVSGQTAQQQQQEQQREQQAREQQQREQQAREQQAREEQQRQEQQPEQQAREQQQQVERQREEQERQRQTPGNPANSSSAASPSVNSSVTSPIPATSQVSNDSFATSSKANAATESHVPFRNRRNPGAELDGRTNATGGDRRNTTAKDQDLRLTAPDLLHKPCDKEPCKEPGPKPVPSDPHAKLCKVGPCPICAPGQSPGKDNSCVSPILAKKATAPPKTSAVRQACPADQIWNGIQCAPLGAQRCLPGQTGAGPSCQMDCTIATAGAQNYIERLRMARQAKDQACTWNSTQQECQQAESTYNIRLNEYRAFLAGVSTTCTLPDPISI